MPDMERITDQLRVDMAKAGCKEKGKCSEYWDGYRNGKDSARREVVVIFLILAVALTAARIFIN